MGLDLDGMLEDLGKAKEGSVFVLHTYVPLPCAPCPHALHHTLQSVSLVTGCCMSMLARELMASSCPSGLPTKACVSARCKGVFTALQHGGLRP